LLAELVGHLERGQSYALVFDMTNTETPSAMQRRKLSEHMLTHQDRIQRCVRCLAVVAPSPIQRGITTAVFWLSPPPIEWRIFDLLDEATKWAQSRCAV
jgi:hypothetical protein